MKKYQSRIIAILPLIIILLVLLLFVIFTPTVRGFVSSNDKMINCFLSVSSVILSGFAVFYSRKAYCVAQDIFEKGINVNKEKILDQLGLEFVIDLFIPLTKLKKSIDNCIKNGVRDASVSTLYDAFKNNKLPDKFIFYDSHKSDIWDSLTICKDIEQEKAFSQVSKLIDEYVTYQTIANNVIRTLEKYSSSPQKIEDLIKSDIIQESSISLVNTHIEKLVNYEDNLPLELGIKEKKRKMYVDLFG